ncbi:MAG: hypothetical protein PHG16_07875 [Lachnospiraceae bacterium]|nr:hypothetical protein [Lachnospiraceae bacterium]
MHKKMRTLVVLGVTATFAANILTGCQTSTADTKADSTASVQESQQTDIAPTESPQEESLPAAEHPSFISDGIRKLVLTKDGQELFYLSREPAAYKMDFDYWEILNPYDEVATVNTETMYQLFDVLSQWDFTSPVTVPEGTDTGIRDSITTMQIDFVNSTDAAVAKAADGAESTATLLIGKEDGAGNYYTVISGYEDTVYTIPVSTVDSVYQLKPFDYLLKIPALINIDTIKSAAITVDGKEYQMSIDNGSYFFDKKEVEQSTFTALYQAMAGVIVESEMGEAKTDKAQEVLSIDYVRNTKEAPEVNIVYSTYDDTYDSVSINGVERYLVKHDDVTQLITQIKHAIV